MSDNVGTPKLSCVCFACIIKFIINKVGINVVPSPNIISGTIPKYNFRYRDYIPILNLLCVRVQVILKKCEILTSNEI